MLRFLIAGYGGMGVRRVDQLKKTGLAEAVGVYDTDEAQLRAARAAGLRVVGDLSDLMAIQADCALVMTPNDTHAALAKALLAAGLHVLVEKPAALSLAELRGMYEGADKAGRLLSVCMNRRGDSDIRAIREVIRGGSLGRLLRLESRVHGSRGIPGGWRLSPRRGGGMLYDWGVHLVDQALMCFEDEAPISVACALSHALGYSVDDGFYLTLEMSGGARVYIEVSTCNFIPLPRFYAVGREGSAIIDDWRGPCRVARCIRWEERGPGVRLMSPRDEKTLAKSAHPLPAGEPDEFLRNFCAAVRGEEPLQVTREQTERVTRIIDAAFESAHTGRTVAL